MTRLPHSVGLAEAVPQDSILMDCLAGPSPESNPRVVFKPKVFESGRLCEGGGRLCGSSRIYLELVKERNRDRRERFRYLGVEGVRWTGTGSLWTKSLPGPR